MTKNNINRTTPRKMNGGVRVGAVAAVSVIALAACGSQSAGDAGVELVEGELTEEIDLGPLDDVTCSEPDSEEVGEVFSCSATTESGETIEIAGIMTDEEAIELSTRNVVLAQDFELLSADAVQVTATNFDVDPATLSVECPDETTFLDEDRQVFCELTDAFDGTTYQLIVNLGDHVVGEGFPDLSYEVGEPIS